MTDELPHREAAQSTADRLLRRLDQARAVIVASEDGFELGYASAAPLDAARIAAITSSMSAIGGVVSRETRMGAVRCVMVEAEDGFLVMRSSSRQGMGMVVAAMIGRDSLVGLAMHAVAEAARELGR